MSLADDLRTIAMDIDPDNPDVETFNQAADLLDRQTGRIAELEQWQRDACGTLLAFDGYGSTPGSRLAFDSIRRHLLQRAGREP